VCEGVGGSGGRGLPTPGVLVVCMYDCMYVCVCVCVCVCARARACAILCKYVGIRTVRVSYRQAHTRSLNTVCVSVCVCVCECDVCVSVYTCVTCMFMRVGDAQDPPRALDGARCTIKEDTTPCSTEPHGIHSRPPQLVWGGGHSGVHHTHLIHIFLTCHDCPCMYS
jgi:hypothetical protein